ncbi:MAG: hypothetical protein ACRD3B_20810, partial [Candidatus Sulfotelmatobacter sp.]
CLHDEILQNLNLALRAAPFPPSQKREDGAPSFWVVEMRSKAGPPGHETSIRLGELHRLILRAPTPQLPRFPLFAANLFAIP